LILILFCIEQNGTAQDTLSLAKPAKHKFQADPLKATMLAVVFPGLGQIYNRAYWKIPLVYAGFGALIYTAGFNSKNYTTYMQAYQDFTDASPKTIRYQVLINAPPESYDPLLHPETYSYYKDQMLRMVDYYKRYRDLSYIGIAGWYLISILDANVDASLFNYDISDNLDVAVLPVQLPLPGGYLGAGIGVSFKVTF
jgi:hypothetical protein